MAFLAKDILEIYKILAKNRKNDLGIKDVFNIVSYELETNGDIYDFQIFKEKNLLDNENSFAMYNETFEFSAEDKYNKNYDDIDFNLIKKFLN